MCDLYPGYFKFRYTPYNANGDLNVYTEKYTPSVYTYTPQGMATFDLSSATTDFVDSTTFDQRQPIDTLPDTNGLLSTTVSANTIINNSHLGWHLNLQYLTDNKLTWWCNIA